MAVRGQVQSQKKRRRKLRKNDLYDVDGETHKDGDDGETDQLDRPHGEDTPEDGEAAPDGGELDDTTPDGGDQDGDGTIDGVDPDVEEFLDGDGESELFSDGDGDGASGHASEGYQDGHEDLSNEGELIDRADQLIGEDQVGQDLDGDGEGDPSEGVDQDSDGEIVDGVDHGTEDVDGDGDDMPVKDENPSEGSTALGKVVDIHYIIGLPSFAGHQRQGVAYLGDLAESLEYLAEEIGDPAGLDVSLSAINEVTVTDCPPHISPDDECKDVQASVGLLWVLDKENIDAFVESTVDFEVKLQMAIEDQKLQEALDAVNPTSHVYIVTGTKPSTVIAGETEVGGISYSDPSNAVEQAPQNTPPIGSLLGMIAAGLFMALLVFAFFLYRRRKPNTPVGKDQEVNLDSEVTDLEDARNIDSATSSSNENASQYPYDEGNAMDDVSSIASSSICYLPQNQETSERLPHHEGDDQPRLIVSKATRDMTELDIAIKNGDWASAGRQASNLAVDYSYDNSFQGGSSRYRPNMQTTINPARSAEIDRMVEAGDWQAVLNATNRYAGEEETSGNQYLPMGLRSAPPMSTSKNLEDDTESRAPSISSSKVSLVSIVESVHSMLGYASIEPSENASAKSSVLTSTDPRMKEIHQEIEVLVNDVVPEEIDNVGELMIHFEGKEEELLHTLETMKSRFEGQRNRLARKRPPSMVTASRPTVALAVPVTNVPAPTLSVPTPPTSGLEPEIDLTEWSKHSSSGDDESDAASEFDFERALAESSAAAASSSLHLY